MSTKNVSVFGIFRDRSSLDEAMTNLEATGFRSTDFSVLQQENQGTKDLGVEKKTKAGEGAAGGALAGLIVGGVLGWLIGSGRLTVPDLRALASAGPIVAAFAAAGAMAILGGLIGALAGLSTPEYEAKRYKGRIKHGGILFSLHCDDDSWVKRAEEMLRMAGAEDIAHRTESRGDYSISERPMPRVRKPAFESGAPIRDIPARDVPSTPDPELYDTAKSNRVTRP